MEAHLFDLDHTLLEVNCSYRFGAYLYNKRVFSFFTMLKLVANYALHKAGLLSMTHLHKRIFNTVFLGKKMSDITCHLDAFLEQECQLYMPAVERLKRAQKKGYQTALLSSAPDFLVRAIAKKLCIENWKATIYKVSEQGLFLEISKVMEGVDKAAYSKQLKVPVTAYSDSHLDLPFLQAADKAVAVNPTKKLRKYSNRLGWEII